MNTVEQQNLKVISEFVEQFWNKNDFACTDQFLSDDYQELSYQSTEGLKKFAATILESFPDKGYVVEDIMAKDDKVLVRMNVKGTHEGMFFGTAPTGNTIDVTLYRQYRVAEGKITEHRGWIDMVTMWSQIRGNK
jgi:predicted ester cyclase